MDEVVTNSCCSIEYVCRDDQLEQRYRAHSAHHGTGGIASPCARQNQRQTPGVAVIWQALFVLVAALIIGTLSGGLADPLGGSNLYGYLGFALTCAILPIYALANWATIVYFRKRPDFNWFRHMVLPMCGGLLMIALLVGQIIVNQSPPFNWMPWVILAWLTIVILGAVWLKHNKPEALTRAGSIMANGEVEE